MAVRPDEKRIKSPRRVNDSTRSCMLHAIHWGVHPHRLLLGHRGARRDNRSLVTSASLGLEGSGCIVKILDLEGAYTHAGAALTSMVSEQEDMALWMEGEEA